MKDEINDYKYKISIKNKLLTDKNNDIIALKKKLENYAMFENNYKLLYDRLVLIESINETLEKNNSKLLDDLNKSKIEMQYFVKFYKNQLNNYENKKLTINIENNENNDKIKIIENLNLSDNNDNNNTDINTDTNNDSDINNDTDNTYNNSDINNDTDTDNNNLSDLDNIINSNKKNNNQLYN